MLPAVNVRAGLAMLGQQVVVHGKDVHHDCLGMSFVHYFLFSAIGREVDEGLVRLLEKLWIATGYPDIRIWCNRIAGYMGSARVPPGLSLCAALAASNSKGYGFQAINSSFLVQQEIPESLPERKAYVRDAIARKRILAGYGRPVGGPDERIPCALKTLIDAGKTAGPALKRAYWLHQRLQEEKNIEWNISAVWAALCIDFGFTSREYEQFMLLMFVPGYAAAYGDQRSRPPFSFLNGYQSWPSATR